MSTTDPDARWWNSNRTRRTLAYALAAMGIIAAFVGGAGMPALGVAEPLWVPEAAVIACLVAAIPLLVGSALLHAFGVDDTAQPTRFFSWALPLYFVAMGAGSLIGAAQLPYGLSGGEVVFVLFIIGGILAIVIIELWRHRSQRTARVERRATHGGLKVMGTVTRAKSYSVDYQAVTRVTVRFTDNEGNQRWTKQRMYGNIRKGARVQVQYSPADLGRRGAVVVTPR